MVGNNNRKITKSKKANGKAQQPPVERLHGFRSLNALIAAPTFAPLRTRRTLRYVTGTTLTGTAGALAGFYIRALSLFDPEYAIGGHQPMGFDQMMTFYEKFTVVASKITVEFVLQSVPQVLGIQLVPVAGTAYSNTSGIIETGMCVHRVYPVTLYAPQKLSLEQVTTRSLGNVDVLDDPGVSGSATADPTQILQFMIFTQDLGTASTATAQLLITVDYDTIFSNPVQPGQS
jgi:hypothetical protein